MAWWIFQSLVTTAALAALVAAVCRFARIGPVARHALWVLVLVKFVMPPLVVWPWAAPDPLRLARSAPRAIGPATADDRRATEGETLPLNLPEITPPLGPPRIAASPDAIGSISAWKLFAFVWLAGSVCLGLLELVRQVRLARRVRSAAPADPNITRRVSELASALEVPSVPVVALADSVSPAVWCLGRPRLLWPAALEIDSQAGIDGIIVHELAHIKRRDHIVGWLELVAGLAWWWNPLFWSVQRARREQAELACDAWVISALPEGRRAYAESLLALSSAGALAPPMAAVTPVRASTRRVLERRLVMIMNGRASLRLPSTGLLALALLAAATLPAWATGTADESQQPPQLIQPAPAAPKIQDEKPKSKPIAKSKSEKPPVLKVDRGKHPFIVKVQPQPPAKVVRYQDVENRYWLQAIPGTLTDEGQKLVTDYSSDLEAIQKEMQAKMNARREAVTQALQALQEQYTKAGKLDEAVAIRDYLKAGGPGWGANSYWYIKK